MKVSVIAIGKIKEKWMREGIAEYVKRLTPFTKIDWIEYGEERISDKSSATEKEQLLTKEGEKLLKTVSERDSVILLDVKGTSLTSEAFSEWIERRAIEGRGRFVFIIGGPHGNGENIRKRADLKLSLSAMTFTHQMSRLILIEQFYRAMKILYKEPYHL